MRLLRSVVRSAQVVGYIALAVVELLIMRPATRQGRAEWLHRLCARAVRGLGVNVEVSGTFPAEGAVISNHLSYVDIVIFAAMHPCVFVSKAEIEGWPVVGWMTTMAGTVYVQRGYGGSAVKARKEMNGVFNSGLPVVFFPEGTTSNGSGLLKFHSGLLAQVLSEGVPVRAAYVKYGFTEGNGKGISVADDVCYWGDRDIRTHIFRFLGLRGVKAEVRFTDDPVAFTDGGADRKLAAVEAREAVAALGGVDLGVPEGVGV
jgi:1-acyl-sn-glycerol-3-phosphate acyltransferase